MQISTLQQQKKELALLDKKELMEICLRLAKYKKENKELLNYLLFDARDPLAYAEQVKASLEDDFKSMQKHYYYSTKSLRKILRLVKKHAKYTASKQVELELLIWFCAGYLKHVDTRSSHQPLRTLLTRQLENIKKLLPKLHEDLQFDYEQEYRQLIMNADEQIRWFNKNAFLAD